MKKVTNNDTPKIEVEYQKAKLWKRIVAFLIDAVAIFAVAVLFFSLSNLVYRVTPQYQNNMSIMNNLKIDSGLYVIENGQVVPLVDKIEQDKETSIVDKNLYLSQTIDDFYINKNFFPNDKYLKNYKERQENYKVNNENIFIKNGDKIEQKKDVNPEYFYTFYKAEINVNAIGCINLSVSYLNAQRSNFITYIVMFVICLFVSYGIFVLVLPLTVFKRGRQTISMKLMKISYVSVEGVNVTAGKFVGRFFFSFLTYIVLNFFAFFIPLIVSTTMMVLGKANQTLNEYVFNDYMVNTERQQVFLDYADYFTSKELNESTSLKNIEVETRK
ncbi:MAG: RDD family protein [Bacilli bacterium]|nr:RDD family protein [Bacilli bacterium]